MTRGKVAALFVASLMVGLALAACSSSASDRAWDVAAGEAIKLKAVDGSSDYRIIPYWTSEQDATTGFTVKAPAAAAAKRASIAQPARGLAPAAERRWAKRIDLDRFLRASEAESVASGLARETKTALEHAVRPAWRPACGSGQIERGGQCVSEFALTFSAKQPSSEIDVVVKAVGASCTVVVDKDDESAVSAATAQSIVDRFDKIILPRDHALFGSPVIDGTDYADADGDGRRMIVLTHLVSDLGAVGFFYDKDFLKTGGNGNAADLLWIVPPDADNTLDSIYGTVAHEYFHLLHFAIKSVRLNVQETTFVAESLAHLAEDASGFGRDNVDTAWTYLDAADKTTWAFSDDSVEARGMGFLLLRYWFERAGGVDYSTGDGSVVIDKGGAAFLKRIVNTGKTGFRAVEEGLGSSWKSHFFAWIAAVELDGLSLGDSENWSYNGLYSDPVTGQQIGVCTHCTRKNAAGQDVEFSGFVNEELTEDYEGSLQAGGLMSLTTSVSGDTELGTSAEDGGLRFAVVRVN